MKSPRSIEIGELQPPSESARQVVVVAEADRRLLPREQDIDAGFGLSFDFDVEGHLIPNRLELQDPSTRPGDGHRQPCLPDPARVDPDVDALFAASGAVPATMALFAGDAVSVRSSRVDTAGFRIDRVEVREPQVQRRRRLPRLQDATWRTPLRPCRR